MEQIRGFFRSDFSAFGAGAPNTLKSDLKKPRICPIWGQSDPFLSQTYHPWHSHVLDAHLSRDKGCKVKAIWVELGILSTKHFVIARVIGLR